MTQRQQYIHDRQPQRHFTNWARWSLATRRPTLLQRIALVLFERRNPELPKVPK